MRNRTVKSRLVAALSVRGFEVDHNHTSAKFICMGKKDFPTKFFVGPQGELRQGADYAHSTTSPTAIRDQFLKEKPQ